MNFFAGTAVYLLFGEVLQRKKKVFQVVSYFILSYTSPPPLLTHTQIKEIKLRIIVVVTMQWLYLRGHSAD